MSVPEPKICDIACIFEKHLLLLNAFKNLFSQPFAADLPAVGSWSSGHICFDAL